MTDDDESPQDKLFGEALDLLIRLQNDPDNPAARDLIARWRSRGPDHESAWAEALELHGMAGKVLEDEREAEATPHLSRRSLVLGGAGTIAALGTGALFGPGLLLRAQADHATNTAEIRRISLADSSILTLGPDSAIRLAMNAQRREIELLAGMLFVKVSNEAGPPFRAQCAGLEITASDGAFELSADAGAISVSVDQGKVTAKAPASPLVPDEELAAGDRLTLEPGGEEAERSARAPDQIAAWRDGMIVAERETVAAVVARIARWQPGRVMIADPDLGARRISGIFDTSDTIAALQAVVQPHGGHVHHMPWLTVITAI